MHKKEITIEDMLTNTFREQIVYDYDNGTLVKQLQYEVKFTRFSAFVTLKVVSQYHDNPIENEHYSGSSLVAAIEAYNKL